MRHIGWKELTGLGTALLLSVAVGVAATAVMADDDTPTPDSATVLSAGESCLSAAGLEGFELRDDDRRFWDEARYAAESGWGIVPDPYPAQSWTPGKRDRAEIEACAQHALANTPEERAAKARAKILNAAGPTMAAEFGDPDEYLLSLPEVADALDGWSACMAAAGYSFENPGAAVDFVEAKVDALGELPPVPLVPADQTSAAWTERDKRIQAEWAELEPQLEQLRTEEREVAVASVECKRSDLYPALIELAQ